MKQAYRSSKSFDELQKKAEEVVKAQDFKAPEGDQHDLMRLLYELEVQRVELEIQNEELVRANKALENSRNEFAELYQTAPVAMIKLSKKGIIEKINDAAAQLFVPFKKFYVGTAFSSLVVPEDRSLYFSALDEFSLNRTPAVCDLRLSGDDGRMVYVQLNARAKHISENQFEWHIALVDITERMRAEAALRESEIRYRTVGESIPYGIWQTDADGFCTYVSDSFLEMTGMTLPELQKFGWLHLLPPEDRKPTQEHWLGCVRSGTDFQREHRFYAKDGATRFVLAIGRPIRNERDEMTGLGRPQPGHLRAQTDRNGFGRQRKRKPRAA